MCKFFSFFNVSLPCSIVCIFTTFNTIIKWKFKQVFKWYNFFFICFFNFLLFFLVSFYCFFACFKNTFNCSPKSTTSFNRMYFINSLSSARFVFNIVCNFTFFCNIPSWIYKNNFKTAKIDMGEFLTQCRVNGYFNIDDIDTAIIVAPSFYLL